MCLYVYAVVNSFNSLQVKYLSLFEGTNVPETVIRQLKEVVAVKYNSVGQNVKR